MTPEVTIEQLQITDFTGETREGTGVFDSFMRATKAHIAEEYNQNRIKGTEYATVYLSALNATADRALEFLMRKDEQWLKNQALQLELDKAQLEKDKLLAEKLLIEAQTEKVGAEKLILDEELKIVEKRFLMMEQEKDKLLAEIELIKAQDAKVDKETILIQKEIDRAEIQDQLLEAQKDKLVAEKDLIEEQKDLAEAQALKVEAETDLVKQQETNAKTEDNVLRATECKLKAEYNLALEQINKIGAEVNLLVKRAKTEDAQTNAGVIGDKSILDHQRILYSNQAAGFVRDAEQKAAKMMIDTWNVRRTTDEGLPSPDSLTDREINQVVAKLKSGIGA